MIVISFALVVGAAIGMICGEVFGDLFAFDDDDDATGDDAVTGACEWDYAGAGKSWFGGAIEALLRYTGASGLAALPASNADGNAAVNNTNTQHPLERLAMRLFGVPSGITWETADIDNPDNDFIEKMYKLYEKKQQATLLETAPMAEAQIDCGYPTCTNARSDFLVGALSGAGFAVNANRGDAIDSDAGLVSVPVVYADIGAGDCKLTLAIAKAINAAKIYNIDVGDYCTETPQINYIDGSIDKTIDIPDASVNLITMINSLHHMGDYEHKIAEAKRILAPNGLLLVSDHVIDGDNSADLQRIIRNQHYIHYVNHLTSRDTLLDYNEFKAATTAYITRNQLHLFDREKLDKLFLGGAGNVLSMVSFAMRGGRNYDNTFVAVYKKNNV
ncbi:hypothetical protein F-VV57_0339 [Faustovirus]|nr:hypothetical protein F-VV57_0339 [Faustovirus]QJX73607.1 hypothetical protein F-VV63_0341 [Faustovirus]